MDAKLFLFTKAFNFLLFFSVLGFSIVLYIAYFWIADNVRYFLIFKTGKALLSSPTFYLIVLLVIGIAVIFDVFYLVVVREWQTPVYLLFKSLMENKQITNEERERVSKLIAEKIKHNKYDL